MWSPEQARDIYDFWKRMLAASEFHLDVLPGHLHALDALCQLFVATTGEAAFSISQDNLALFFCAGCCLGWSRALATGSTCLRLLALALP